MFRTLPLLGIAALAAVALTGCSQDTSDTSAIDEAALSETPPSASQLADSIPGTPAELQAEYATLQQRLNQLQQQALQDTSIANQVAALEEEVDRRMRASDPDVPGNVDRLGQIQGEIDEAQQAGETERVQALVQEGRGLQRKLRQLREQVLTADEMQPRMESVRTAVLARMTELDPEAQKMMDRTTAIVTRLRAASPPPGGTTP